MAVAPEACSGLLCHVRHFQHVSCSSMLILLTLLTSRREEGLAGLCAGDSQVQILTMKHIMQAPADDGGVLSAQACVPEEGFQQALVQPYNDIPHAPVPLLLISDCQNHLQRTAQ